MLLQVILLHYNRTYIPHLYVLARKQISGCFDHVHFLVLHQLRDITTARWIFNLDLLLGLLSGVSYGMCLFWAILNGFYVFGQDIKWTQGDGHPTVVFFYFLNKFINLSKNSENGEDNGYPLLTGEKSVNIIGVAIVPPTLTGFILLASTLLFACGLDFPLPSFSSFT